MSKLDELLDCMRAWEPDARILGNVTFGEAISEIAALRAKLGMAEEHIHVQRSHILELQENVNDHNRTIARLTADKDRLRSCMKTAGLECFIRDGTPEQIAEHMRAVAKSSTAEIAALRARCGRMAAEVKAWRTAWRRCDIIMHPDGKKAIDSTISTSLHRINLSQLAVDRNNDLADGETGANE